jgi:hypothetical protein
MTKAEYLVISAVTYDEPIHPGAQPAHQGNATSAQMTKASRLYDGRITQVSLHVSDINALCQQILCAVDNMYLMALEHPELGYLISPHDMLLHLQDKYGNITPLKIEQNCATLTSTWNLDNDIEGLWMRIRDVQLLAHQANEEILDPAAIRLTVQAVEASGVFDFALDNWRLKDDATKMMLSFKDHINKKDRVNTQIQNSIKQSEKQMTSTIQEHISNIMKSLDNAINRIEKKANEVADQLLGIMQNRNTSANKTTATTPRRKTQRQNNDDVDMQEDEGTMTAQVTPASHKSRSQYGRDKMASEQK